MIAHQGETIIIGSVFMPINGGFNLADYTVQCVITNMKGQKVLEISGRNIIRNNAENAVTCMIHSGATKVLEGLYFVSFELWANGEMVLSNEVEQVTIIA